MLNLLHLLSSQGKGAVFDKICTAYTMSARNELQMDYHFSFKVQETEETLGEVLGVEVPILPAEKSAMICQSQLYPVKHFLWHLGQKLLMIFQQARPWVRRYT